MTVLEANGYLRGPLDCCTSIPQLCAVVSAVCGLDAVEQLVREAGIHRESLRAAADEVKAVGLLDLANVLRKASRKAPEKPIEHRSYLERRALRRRQRPN
jgi:hypothetical protein